MIICDYKKCTGCMACSNICPQNAIEFTTDKTQKSVPLVNSELCVNCGVCKKVCPSNLEESNNKSFKCYAAYNIKGADCTESSSAGVSHAIGIYVIENGGTVFGAAYKNGKLMHISSSDAEGIKAFRGSKYVQSNIGTAYRMVKKELLSGKQLVFTGTPCQIAGLNSYLGKDYPNLITVDIICHGVPSAKLLDDYLSSCGVSDYESISFRQGSEYNLIVYGKNGKELFRKNAAFDPYYRAFYNNISLRDNCFECPYANAENRPADISIGDFWGLNKNTLKEKTEGKVSLVLINTEKGDEFWNKIQLNSEERSIDEAAGGNAQLRLPSKKNADTDKFYENYAKGFIYAINKTCVKKNIQKNKAGYVKEKIKAIIKKGLRL